MAPWKKRLLALAGGSIFALVFLEIALRLAGVSFQDFYKADPVRGVAHRAGARGWFRREGRQYIVINRDGFRDRDHPRLKPPGTYRIAILGDSFTEALQVRLEDGFASVLERELASCPTLKSKVIEVFNFGVSNYGTAQELLTLRERAWDVEPDLVLLAFYTGNDIRDNSKALKRDPELPYFTLEEGRLVLDDSFRTSPRQRAEKSVARVAFKAAIESSRILQVIRQAWGVARLKASPASAGLADEFGGDPAHRQLYREPTDPEWRAAWDVTERLILTIRDEVADRGARFALVTLTTSAQVHPDPKVVEQAEKKLDVPDLDYPDRRLRELGERAGFAVLNLAPGFRREAEEGDEGWIFYHGFEPAPGTGHWNERGHRVAGRLIARWLCDELEKPPGRPLEK